MESKVSASLQNNNPPDPGTAAPVLIAPPEAQVQVPKRRNKRLKLLPEYINKYIVSERPLLDGRIDKYYRHKVLHINFRSLAEVERYESRCIYPRYVEKRKENQNQLGLHEPLLALTYEGTEQLNIEKLDASTKEVIIYENIKNGDTCNSPKTGMRIPEEQYHMTEPCNNMYMPNPANVSSPKVAETTGYIIEATPVSTLPPEAQAPTSKRRYNKLKPLLEFLNNWIVTESPRKNGRIDKLLTYGETGKQNEKLETSTMERTNSENMHMSNLTTSTSTAPKGRRGRKRKMKTVVSLEAETSIGVEQNNETTPIDVPINDEAALIDVAINDKAAPIGVPIIDEAAMIDVPITYVENFSDLGH